MNMDKNDTSQPPQEQPCQPLEASHCYQDYENSTYNIVSTVAYLLGVPKRIFENEHEPPELTIYEELQRDKNARIMRNLCMLRTIIERNFKKIGTEMCFNLKNLHTLPDIIPPEVIQQLIDDGISVIKANYQIEKYITDINQIIVQKINTCKMLFPIWLNWEYIKQLFIMPNGTTDKGAQAAWKKYMSNISSYPYQVYMHWDADEDGNILYNDKKFVTLLYARHNEIFNDMSKVTDAGNLAKNGIYEFLASSSRTCVVVDCENSNPYKLYATLNNMDPQYFDKIVKIILYNDVHTASTWTILSDFIDIPIEHEMIERVKQSKSLVDIRLTAGACKEHYTNHVDSFVIVSSDSDYWGLISSLPDAQFLVMVESEKCGVDIKNALQSHDIFYCYIDDFCTGNSNDLKACALLTECRQYIKEHIQLNVHKMLELAYTKTRAEMSASEHAQFYNRYIKPMKLAIDADGNVTLQLG